MLTFKEQELYQDLVLDVTIYAELADEVTKANTTLRATFEKKAYIPF